MPETKTATFRWKYDCKGSRRFECTDDDFPLRDVYLKRPYADKVQEFEMEITPIEK